MTIVTPEGCWNGPSMMQASRAEAPVWRYAGGGSYTLVDNARVLAVVSQVGTGAAVRWLLTVAGFGWAVAQSPNSAGRWHGVKEGPDGLFATGKLFMTRTGARIEGEDIIAATRDLVA